MKIQVAGVQCWGADEIATVEVTADGGVTWVSADVEARAGWSWQAFAVRLRGLPARTVPVISRATDVHGRVQPRMGARNASVPVDLEDKAGA